MVLAVVVVLAVVLVIVIAGGVAPWARLAQKGRGTAGAGGMAVS